jgi:hypothetical protein
VGFSPRNGRRTKVRRSTLKRAPPFHPAFVPQTRGHFSL